MSMFINRFLTSNKTFAALREALSRNSREDGNHSRFTWGKRSDELAEIPSTFDASRLPSPDEVSDSQFIDKVRRR